MGYIVYTVSTDIIGGSTTEQIKSYIQMAYDTFDPPPEYVTLIGDVDGLFNIPTFFFI